MIDEMFTSMKQIRCLHVNSGFGVGGIESWLVSVSKYLDRRNIVMDVMVGKPGPEPLAEEFLKYGGQVHYCGPIAKPWGYLRKYIKILKDHGPYNVVHCHIGPLSWFVLSVAWLFGISVRITTSHSEYYNLESFSNRIFRAVFAKLIAYFSTCSLAVSSTAGRSLFGDIWGDNSCNKIFHLGIDLDKFINPSESPVSRASLAIPDDAFVVGHIGGFRPVKNHRFIIEIAVELLKIIPDARFLLVGSGSLEAEIRQEAMKKGVISNVVFTGFVKDVPAYLEVMDCFLFPSLSEGFGLSLLEAQIAGITSVVSDNITPDVDTIPGTIIRLPLSLGASSWAEKIAEVIKKNKIERKVAAQYFKGSSADVRVSAEKMMQLYINCLRSYHYHIT
jgi:glycosyltransferase involved in cell wall biosynthesis